MFASLGSTTQRPGARLVATEHWNDKRILGRAAGSVSLQQLHVWAPVAGSRLRSKLTMFWEAGPTQCRHCAIQGAALAVSYSWNLWLLAILSRLREKQDLLQRWHIREHSATWPSFGHASPPAGFLASKGGLLSSWFWVSNGVQATESTDLEMLASRSAAGRDQQQARWRLQKSQGQRQRGTEVWGQVTFSRIWIR